MLSVLELLEGEAQHKKTQFRFKQYMYMKIVSTHYNKGAYTFLKGKKRQEMFLLPSQILIRSIGPHPVVHISLACSSFAVVPADLSCSLSAGPVSVIMTYAQLAWNLISNPGRWHPASNQVSLLTSKTCQCGFGNDGGKNLKMTPWPLVFRASGLWLQYKLAFHQCPFSE